MPSNESVYHWIENLFTGVGMPGMGAVVRDALKGSATADQALSIIRDSPEYAKRFPGNIILRREGTGMMSEGEYIAMEKAYAAALHAAGLPEGFYDDPEDYGKWIADSVSPAEIGRRADAAGALLASSDPKLFKTLQDYYGLKKGEIAAWALDSDRAEPVLMRKIQASRIGAEARRFDIDNAKRRWANRLASAGVSVEQANAAFGKTADSAGTWKLLTGLDVKGRQQPARRRQQDWRGWHPELEKGRPRRKRGQGPLTERQVAAGYLGQNARARKQMASASRAERARFGGTVSSQTGEMFAAPDI